MSKPVTPLDKAILFFETVSDFYSLALADLRFLEGLASLGSPETSHLFEVLEKRGFLKANTAKEIGELIKRAQSEFKLKNLHFAQSNAYTCSIACYLMNLSVYKKGIRPSKQLELSLYHKLKMQNAELVMLSALLEDALSQDLFLQIFSEKDYEKIAYPKGSFAEDLRQNYLNFLGQHAGEEKLVNTITAVESSLFRLLLEEGRGILINGTAESIPHMRFISGYSADNFIVDDPLMGQKVIMAPSELARVSNPPFGKWCATITSKPFDFPAAR